MDCIKNYVNHQSIWVVMICNNFCFTNIARSISNIIYLACCFLNSVGTIQIRFHQIIFSNFSVLNLNKHQKHPQVLNSEVASFPAFRAFLSHRGYPQASSIFWGFRKPTSELGVPPMTLLRRRLWLWSQSLDPGRCGHGEVGGWIWWFMIYKCYP